MVRRAEVNETKRRELSAVGASRVVAPRRAARPEEQLGQSSASFPGTSPRRDAARSHPRGADLLRAITAKSTQGGSDNTDGRLVTDEKGYSMESKDK